MQWTAFVREGEVNLEFEVEADSYDQALENLRNKYPTVLGLVQTDIINRLTSDAVDNAMMEMAEAD